MAGKFKIVIREIRTKFLFLVDEDFWDECLEPFQRGFLTEEIAVKYGAPNVQTLMLGFVATGTGGDSDTITLIATKNDRHFERTGAK
jgi:hypothetical protein